MMLLVPLQVVSLHKALLTSQALRLSQAKAMGQATSFYSFLSKCCCHQAIALLPNLDATAESG